MSISRLLVAPFGVLHVSTGFGNHQVLTYTLTGEPMGAIGYLPSGFSAQLIIQLMLSSFFSSGGCSTSVSFSSPQGMVFAPDHSLLVLDTDHSLLRRLTPDSNEIWAGIFNVRFVSACVVWWTRVFFFGKGLGVENWQSEIFMDLFPVSFFVSAVVIVMVPGRRLC